MAAETLAPAAPAAAEVAAWARSTGLPCDLPGDPGHERRRWVYNRLHDMSPSAIVAPRDAADVRQLLLRAHDAGLPLTVRGGGHHVAGYGTSDGGVVVDLRAMRRVRPSADGREVAVGGGARLRDVDAALCPRGLVVPTGTVSDTGIGGLALGGGIGWLVGLRGLTCDNIVGAEVVLPSGAIVHAGEPEHADLLWALRGGGGGFGVVTEFRFRAAPLPPCTVGTLTLPLRAAAAALRRLLAFLDEDCPRALTVAPLLRRDAAGEPILAVDFCAAGADDAVDRLVAAVRPERRAIERRSDYRVWQRSSDALFAEPLRGYWKAAYKPELGDRDVEAIVASMEAAPPGSPSILVEHLHGAFHDTGRDDAAFPLRDAAFGVLFSARWADAEDDAAAISWARSGVAAVDPEGASGSYANYAPHDDRRVARDFDRRPAVRERLRRVKAACDPHDVLARHHRSGGATHA
jgi:FAD/FMN-containing dehydrogenase